mmetsp:Transcript_28722/g.70809  ORF Transcript_28722/g.70809 Transcript_28722/m.70809 type:complete len:331 (+) Transcript_28722:174-1166(+)
MSSSLPGGAKAQPTSLFVVQVPKRCVLRLGGLWVPRTDILGPLPVEVRRAPVVVGVPHVRAHLGHLVAGADALEQGVVQVRGDVRVVVRGVVLGMALRVLDVGDLLGLVHECDVVVLGLLREPRVLMDVRTQVWAFDSEVVPQRRRILLWAHRRIHVLDRRATIVRAHGELAIVAGLDVVVNGASVVQHPGLLGGGARGVVVERDAERRRLVHAVVPRKTAPVVHEVVGDLRHVSEPRARRSGGPHPTGAARKLEFGSRYLGVIHPDPRAVHLDELLGVVRHQPPVRAVGVQHRLQQLRGHHDILRRGQQQVSVHLGEALGEVGGRRVGR